MFVDGDCASLLGESGGHRVQRVPPTERRGRVHTSTVTVAVFSDSTEERDHPARKRSPGDYSVEWYSGSGAGGQHRNKHQNSARVTHLPTGLVRTSQNRKRDKSLSEAMSALNADLDDLLDSDSAGEVNSSRKDQVGSGMRGDKRRTYRFQDDRVTDHVTGKTAPVKKVMSGRIDLLQ